MSSQLNSVGMLSTTGRRSTLAWRRATARSFWIRLAAPTWMKPTPVGTRISRWSMPCGWSRTPQWVSPASSTIGTRSRTPSTSGVMQLVTAGP